jgi:hypothetical protein
LRAAATDKEQAFLGVVRKQDAVNGGRIVHCAVLRTLTVRGGIERRVVRPGIRQHHQHDVGVAVVVCGLGDDVPFIQYPRRQDL